MKIDLLDQPAGARAGVPVVPFRHLSALWIQLTGTWCNLECTHCLNASGPRHPWLRPLASADVRRAIGEAEGLGVKEIYFTGGEPFLHPDLLGLLAFALRAAPTTVLTNGTRIDEAMAERLVTLAEAAPYSLEIRVSLDDVDRDRNDRIRGAGAWAAAVRAITALDARGLLPIVTATEARPAVGGPGPGMYERFRAFLLSMGVSRPRVKIIPVFALGRLARGDVPRLTEEALEGFDRSLLQCADARILAEGGVYACPILAGLPGARLSDGSLAQALGPAPLDHPSCVTCHETGMTCRNA